MRRGRSSGIKPILIDGDARNFGARGFEGRAAPLIAGILDHAECAARQNTAAPRCARPSWMPETIDDAAGIGDDAARRRQMIGDRGAQRRKSRRIAILGQTRRAAMRQIVLQQPAPGLQRKQLGAGPPREEIEQQAVARGMTAICRSRVCRSGIGMRGAQRLFAADRIRRATAPICPGVVRRRRFPTPGATRRSLPSAAGRRRARRCCGKSPVARTAAATTAGACPAQSARSGSLRGSDRPSASSAIRAATDPGERKSACAAVYRVARR